MSNTQIYLHNLAEDHLQSIGNSSQLHDFIDQLASNPDTVGDYRLPDPRGRMIEVKIIGRQALLFFKDPFANIIKILEIRNVEAA